MEFFVAEVLAGEEAELPEVISDVLADVGDSAVGADDDLGVFVGDVSSLFGVGGSCAAHDVAAFVFASGLEVEDALFDHEGAGSVPEVKMEDLAFTGKEVVVDAETFHGLEVTAEDGCGDEVGYLGGIAASGFESMEGVEADLFACD